MKLSDCSETERRELTVLKRESAAMHLRQRLGLEGEHEAHVVRRGHTFLHLENWYSVARLIRAALTLTDCTPWAAQCVEHPAARQRCLAKPSATGVRRLHLPHLSDLALGP